MSSILNKFRKQPQNDVPAGIKIENTLFGQPQGTYQPPIIPSVQLSQTNQPRQKGRPGGGWDDEPEPQQQQQQTSSNMPANTINLINDTPPKQNENKANFGILLPPQPSNNDIQLSRVSEYKKGQLLTYEELEIGGFEFEFHIVEEAIKLGGIKLKQSDSVLKEFARACQTLQEQLIGSILLNKLYSEENWKVQINYLKIDTDQQILKSAIEQTLLEINGQQTQKQKEIQFEFREPPKPQQNAVQQQANLFEIGNNEGQQKQQQQQKLDLKSLKIKQPEVKQQTQQNTQIDLLEAFNQMSVQNPSQNQQQQQNQGINFDEILNTQTTQTVQQPQQKKNAFGFLKKDQQQQPQQQPPQQLKQDQAQLNTLLLQPPQQLYQQPAPNQQQASNIPSGQPSNLYNLQQQAQFGQPNYSQAFAQFNIQQQQYNLVQQTQFSQEQPQQKQQPAPKENAFDFLNF